MLTTMLVILFAVEAVIILGALVAEKTWIAFVSLVACLLIAHFGLDFNVIEPVVADIPMAIVYFFGYLLLGAAYSVVRWFYRVRRTAAKLAKAAPPEPEEDEAQPQRPVGYDGAARRHSSHSNSYEVERLLNRMKPSYNKSTITAWISFWPIDFLVLLFEEPVQRIYEWLTTRYQQIARDALTKHGLDERFGKEIE